MMGDNLPKDNYPMPIELGQVFVIDYYPKNGGGVERRLMRYDSGDYFEGMINTRAFYEY